jgi:hypothetical protein
MASEEKIDRMLLAQVVGSGMRFYAVLLDLSLVPTPPDWVQGTDHLGRGIVLIGDEALGGGPEAREVVAMLLHDLASGGCPAMVARWPVRRLPPRPWWRR